MEIVTLPERLELNPGQIIVPGEYVSENLLCAQLVNLCGDGSIRPLTESRPFDETKDWNGKKLLFMRAGGFGDIVNLTPTLREVKRRWPDCEITVAAMPEYGKVLDGLDYVAHRIDYPVSTKVAEGFDCWQFFERAVEGNPRAHEVHLVDLFAEITGLKSGFMSKDWTDSKKPDYVVSPEETAWCKVAHPRVEGKRRLTVQVSASAKCRVYPMSRLQEVLNVMKAKPDWETFLLGEPGKIQTGDMPGIVNLSMQNTTFRQSAAVVASSDVFLGSDSAFVHVAGALGVPAVALYGPFPWKLRTAYSPSVTAIHGKGKCAPCFFHEKHFGALGRESFPANCPSRNDYEPGMDQRSGPPGYCSVLASIEPKRVVALIEKVAKRA